MELKAIGRFHSEYKSLSETPKSEAEGAEPAKVEVYPEYLQALENVNPGQEYLFLTWLHEADRSVLQCHPRGDKTRPMRGVFDTRSPDRPNPIGLHQSQVLSRQGNILHVHPLEALDKTPVLDIKPLQNRAKKGYWGPGAAAQVAEEIQEIGHLAWQEGIFHGLNGNISLRRQNLILITCSGSAKGHLRPGDLVQVDLETGKQTGQGKMSSESKMHFELYKRQPQAKAILHTHPWALLSLSLADLGVLQSLPFCEAEVYLKELGIVESYPPGSMDLAKAVAEEAAQGKKAIFMQDHGLVCWAENLRQALFLTEEMEALAKMGLVKLGMK